MNYNDLMRHFKTEAAAGAAIDGSRQMVHQWGAKPEAPLPLDKQIKYEAATDGALRADLSDETRAILSKASV